MRVAFASALVAALTVAASASAEPSPSELALARQLFSAASALETEGKWSAAAEKLREALSIKETPGLRYHLAHCEEQAGALVAASLEYARASELIAQGAQAPDVAQLLALADQRLAAQIPRLSLRVPADVSGVSVVIDGHGIPSAVLGNAVPVDPGRHQVLARAPNRSDFSRTVMLEAGESRTLTLDFGPTPPAATASVAPGHDGSLDRGAERSGVDPRTVALIGEGVLAAGGLATGIGFAVARGNAADRVERAQQEVDAGSPAGNAACSDTAPAPACTELKRALDDHQKTGALMAAGFVTAGVAVAAGALTVTLWPSKIAHVAIDWRPGGATLSASGHF